MTAVDDIRAILEAVDSDGSVLRRYWTQGEGLAKWRGAPKPFVALRNHLLRKGLKEPMASRVAAAWYREVMGHWPGNSDRKPGKKRVVKKEAVLSAIDERLVMRANVLAVLEAGNSGPPYEWKHGWIPLTLKARAIKAKKEIGSADDGGSKQSAPKPKPKVDGQFDVGDKVKNPYGDVGTVTGISEVNGKTYIDVDYGDGYPIGIEASVLAHKDGAVKAVPKAPKVTKTKVDTKPPGAKNPQPATPAKVPVAPPKVDPAKSQDRPAAVRARKRVMELGKVKGARSARLLREEFAELHEQQRDEGFAWIDSMSPEERKRAITAINNASKGQIKISTTPQGLDAIIKAGRFKNSHELGTTGSGGVLEMDEYGDLRDRYEQDFMNTDGVPTPELPIYGYAGDSPMAKLYGSVNVNLRPEVRKRSTATIGDSLSGFVQPYPIDDFPKLTDAQLASAVSNDETMNGSLKAHGKFDSYLETQIHGGVTLDDIESVDLPANASPSTIKALRAAGIKVNVAKVKESILALLAHEAATHPGPYQWRHGWIPLTPRAKAIKDHDLKKGSSARGKKHPDGGTGGGLPKPGGPNPVGKKPAPGDEKPKVYGQGGTSKVNLKNIIAPPKPAAKPAPVKPAAVTPTYETGKNSTDPKFGKKVTVNGELVGYVKDGSITSHQMGSVGKVSVGQTKTKKFDVLDVNGKKIATTYHKDDALYELEKAHQAGTLPKIDDKPVNSLLAKISEKMKPKGKPKAKTTKAAPAKKPVGDVFITGDDVKVKNSKIPLKVVGQNGDEVTVQTPGGMQMVYKKGDLEKTGSSSTASSSSSSSSSKSTSDGFSPGDKVKYPGTSSEFTVISQNGDEVMILTPSGMQLVYKKKDLEKIGSSAAPGKADSNPSSAYVGEYDKPNIANTNRATDEHHFKVPGGYGYGSEGFRDVPPGSTLDLTEDESRAVEAYTGASYTAINTGLRTGSGGMPKTVKQIDQAFAKVPPLSKGVRVRRNVENSNALFGPVGSKVGGTFQDKAYVSTTFIHDEKQRAFGGDDITIDLPPGMTALAPDGIGAYGDSEGEVLLPRGTEFKIKGDYIDDQGKRRIHLEAIIP